MIDLDEACQDMIRIWGMEQIVKYNGKESWINTMHYIHQVVPLRL